MQIKVAFVGNPNCGKTTLFNAYTGAKHKVGNWAGVTVEKKEGHIRHDNHNITLVDLPGIYSISPYSMEEILTREYILNVEPDVVINIVDASNLERNLYLTLQLIELGKPVVVALNMMDILEKRGQHLDVALLSEELGVPVIPVSAVKKKGLTKLVHQMIRTTRHKETYVVKDLDYGENLEKEIVEIKAELKETYGDNDVLLRWLAIKILENDSEIMKKAKNLKWHDEDHHEEIAKIRYDHISGFIQEVMHTNIDEHTFSDRVDRVLTNTITGIPIFIGLMMLVFLFTFKVGDVLAGYFETGIVAFSRSIDLLLRAVNVNEMVISLVVDGIIGGVGGILIFLPNIACLFFAISLLEDSGYMARVALVMDKFMRRLSLNGKAFIPMILGFGCSVPAIMSTRSLESERDKIVTIMIIPFMSCSAKVPIYVLFSGVFFPGHKVLVTFSLYILGVVMAIFTASIFKVMKKDTKMSPLLLELPEYKMPAFRSTLIFVWDKVKAYITKAGTIIFVASVVLWFIIEFNHTGKVDMTESFGAMLGKVLAPVFKPLGFGNWQATLALIAGIMGKEIVVSSMAVIYGVSEVGMHNALIGAGFTALSAYSFMVFSLLYIPCVATIGVIKSETKSYKWMFFSMVYQVLVAWVMGMAFYQIGSLFL